MCSQLTVLLSHAVPCCAPPAPHRQIAEGILRASGISGYQLGTSKVFLRAGQMAMLDKQRTEKLSKAATVLQRHARGWLARMHYQQAMLAVVRMQVGVWLVFVGMPGLHSLTLTAIHYSPHVTHSSCFKPVMLRVYVSAGIRARSAGAQGDAPPAPAEGSHQHPDSLAAVQDAPAVQPGAAQHHSSAGMRIWVTACCLGCCCPAVCTRSA